MSLQAVVDFTVIGESDDWIVVNKPAPLIVHPANGKAEPTLLGGLESLLAFELQTGGCLGIVTRLDRETSGIVLVSKHTLAARELGLIFEQRQAKKEYLAIVHGWPEMDEWENAGCLLRAGSLGPSQIWVRQIIHETGRDCLTRFKIERRFERAGGKFSLVRCFPHTGRMHQIRVHLSSQGHPIVGDKLYSGDGAEYLEWMATGWSTILQEKLILPRHALHAAALEISWSGNAVQWQAELPEDMRDFILGHEIAPTPGVVIWSRYD